MADFATRIREKRKSLNLRQIDVANAIGVAQTTIANYEQHTRFPDEATLGEIANFLNVSLDYLLGRSDAYSPHPSLEVAPGGKNLNRVASNYLDLLLCGEKQAAFDAIMGEVKAGMTVREVYASVLEPCLHEIGRLWEIDGIDVAREHFFSAATTALMGQLYPYLDKSPSSKGAVVVAATGGEQHEIGPRMVADLLEDAGWRCYYLGTNIPTADIVRAIREESADVLAISATMISGLDSVRNMISSIRSRIDTKRKLQVVTGGRCFNLNPELWKSVGADGCARSGAEAVRLFDWLASHRS